MRLPILFALAAYVTLAGLMQLCACWAAPPPVVWTQQEQIWVKRDNGTGIISIHDAKEGPSQWQAGLEGFSSLFSIVHVSADAGHVVHVRSNHQVAKLDDTALVIYARPEADPQAEAPATGVVVVQHSVKRFINELVKPKGPRESTAPGSTWLKQVKLTDDAVLLTTVADKHFKIALADGTVTEVQEMAIARPAP